MWADSAKALGYWVDGTPRHKGDVIVFAAGQAGVDSTYGHVAIVESIGSDGSVVTSETNAGMSGKTFTRTFTASEAAAFRYIHY
uniref:CAZy families GH23 protein n=1 Tax=uncultured Bifidobacterium sp. TaxID=165187 RepID=A0A060BTR8_9BIFI|nr:CAZy families GH23 protein [uncultured Bifidobacterium sp.]